MNLKDRISLFSTLGEQIKIDSQAFFGDAISNAQILNPWFSKSNIDTAISSISILLEKESLISWLSHYSIKEKEIKTILLIMAGNIPFVGFHDLLCVLLSGNKAIIKMSTKDNVLMKTIIDRIVQINPKMKDFIIISDEIVKCEFDATIATGSDNSSKYFDYYFKSDNSIIRKNRRSVAILDGSETQKELELLADDIFLYFGLGCRSVSKVFLPINYDLDKLFNAFFKYKNIIKHLKYANNYDYNKTIFLMNKQNLLDNGFVLLKEDSSIQSPISMLFYQYYNNREDLDSYIKLNTSLFQCIVSKRDVSFGKSQFPRLNDYADNIDTLNFLLKI